MRRLIINADDFGLTTGVNAGIIGAHRAGIVRSVTLMANAPAFDDAVTRARANPELAVGCHVVLVDGEPLLSPERVRTLIEQGRLRQSLLAFVRDAMRGRIAADQIIAEATAQIRKVQQAGITVSHVDTHKHAHIFPAVLAPLLAAARGCGVRALRNPFTPPHPLRVSALARRPSLWKRYAQVSHLRRFAQEFRRHAAEAGMVTPDGIFGVVSTGALDLQLFRSIVECIPDGTWEFVCHPGYNDADLAHVRTRLRASREQELGVLTSAEARVFLQERNIELISYRELACTAAGGCATGDA